MNRKNAAFQTVALDSGQLAMLELFLGGYCRPLDGFMDCHETSNVLSAMRLPNGRAWPFPFVLAVHAAKAANLSLGERVVLTDAEGAPLAELEIRDLWRMADLPTALRVQFGHRLGNDESIFLAGKIKDLTRPVHYDFPSLRLSANVLRERLAAGKEVRIVAIQPSDLLHKDDVDGIARIAQELDACILVMAPVSNEQILTPHHYVRVRCLQHAGRYMAPSKVLFSLWPQPWQDPLPEGREVFWRALLARQAGATDLLSEPEWWGDANEEAKNTVCELVREIGINLLERPTPKRGQRASREGPQEERAGENLTTAIIRRLRTGMPIAESMTYPEIIEELRQSHPVKERQGVTIFFTGLSGAGKSTIARVLLSKLLERGNRAVTLLDGDIVRRHLSSELGFSRAHRDINILRIGFVASEITKHGGIAICAPIAPYRETRRRVREMVEEHGGFYEIYVATPLEVCEARDRKGLYAKARAGLIKEFTGISDPYEIPERPEIIVDTRDCSPLEAAQMIIDRIRKDGFIH